MKKIKALVSFVYIGANGSITSYAGGQVYEVPNDMATQMISIGYAEEYNEGGGGGVPSDFSTANVTITNNSDTNWQTQFASLENIGVGEHPDVIVCNTQGISAKTVNDYKIIMYKNYTGLRSQSTATVEVSGNAELIGRVIAITGDCTITIS